MLSEKLQQIEREAQMANHAQQSPPAAGENAKKVRWG
jgi:hypothetical protein